MSELQKAIDNYIECKSTIDNSETILEGLNKEYYERLGTENYGSSDYSISGAERVYKAYKKVHNHNASIENSHESLQRQEKIIIEYLKALAGNKISIPHRFPNKSQDRTISFTLDGENLVCNITNFKY